MNRISLLCLLLAGCSSQRNGPVRIVLPQAGLGQMPLALAQALGFYEQEAVKVAIEMIPSPAKVVEALVANSTDVGGTMYEFALQLTADGRAMRSFAVIVIRDARGIVALPHRKEVRSLGDLKRRNLGVSGLGSSSHIFANRILLQHGMRLDDVSVAGIGMGRSLIAAFERGIVDAAAVSGGDLFHLKFRYPELTILADSSTPEGSRAFYGSELFPAVALIARSQWLEQHPDQARKIARALKRTLQWLQEHTAEEIHERTPEAYRTNDRDAEIESIRNMKQIWSKDGVMPVGGPEAVLRALAVTQEKIRNAKIDLSKTYTNEFVEEKP